MLPTSILHKGRMHFDPEIVPSRHDLNLRPGQGPNESYNRV